MTVYFAANRIGCFITTPDSIETTDTAKFDNTVCSNALSWLNSAPANDPYVATLVDPATGRAVSLTGDFSFHFEWRHGHTGGAIPNWVPWQAEDPSGQGLLRFICTTSQVSPATFKLQYWNGTSFVDCGVSWSYTVGDRVAYDIKGTFGASGNVECYINQQKQGSTGTIASAAASGCAHVRYQTYSNPTVASFCSFSQVIVADEPTLGWKAAQRRLLAAGDYSQWTDFTVANLTDSSDVTYATDSTDGNKSSLTLSQMITTPPAYAKIKAIVLGARVNVVAGATANARFFLRDGGADGDLGYDMVTPNVGFEPRLGIFMSDPATRAPWTIAAANSATLEAGMQDLA